MEKTLAKALSQQPIRDFPQRDAGYVLDRTFGTVGKTRVDDYLLDYLLRSQPGPCGLQGLDGGSNWAVDFPKGEGVACYACHSGRCWIKVEGGAPSTMLTAGDVVFLPSALPYRVHGGLTAANRAFGMLPNARFGEVIVVNGGGDCMGVAAYFQVGDALRGSRFTGVPPMILVNSPSSKRVLRVSIERLMKELREPSIGSDRIAAHLCQALLIKTLQLLQADFTAVPEILEGQS